MLRVWMSVACVLLSVALAMGQSTRPAGQQDATQDDAAVTPLPQAQSTELLRDDLAGRLYGRVSPSLVVVQYVWESEVGARELAGMGVVVSSDGLVMFPLSVMPMFIPDAQLKDFKIIVPRQDREHLELKAVFVGRDERTNLAFFRSAEQREWTPLTFVERPVEPGDAVYSVGLLPKGGGYRPYLARGIVSATLRSDVPWTIVSGGLTAVGSPVFNGRGEAIGLVNGQPGHPGFLYDSGNPQLSVLSAITETPKLFVPSRDFLLGIEDPPQPGEPMRLPWAGISQMHGLKKDVAELYGLGDAPAIGIGEVIAGTSADQAGLRRQMVITHVNGQPLERGDEENDLPAMLARRLMRFKAGEQVTFTVIPAPGQQPQQIAVTLTERPKSANLADRYFAQDLGFSTRDLVFTDTYRKRLPEDQKGVLVAWIKPQSAADKGSLRNDDLIVEFNRRRVSDVKEFQAMYEEFRRSNPNEAVVMMVKREASTQVIRIEPPQ